MVLAAESGWPEIVERLLSKAGEPNIARSKYNMMPIPAAAFTGDVETVKLLFGIRSKTRPQRLQRRNSLNRHS